MKNCILDVAAFHLATGNPVKELPKSPPEDRVTLRKRLLEEEYKETVRALEELPPNSENPQQLANLGKELADLIYVAVGAAIEYGIPLDQIWDQVQASNIQKASGPKREDGKVLKPVGWQPPDVVSTIEHAQRIFSEEKP